MAPSLTSSYLLALKAYFEAHSKSLASSGTLEFEQKGAEHLADEVLEVVLWLLSGVYVVLTVWGDQRATFEIRESRKKRMHKVLLRVPDFPLLVEPSTVYDTFQSSEESLYRLSDPPGGQADESVLEELRAAWLTVSRDELH